MIYKQTYNTLWHDTDAKRELTPTALLAYMQETANRQFYSAGRTLDAIRDEAGVGFILSRLCFEQSAPIYAYEDITVETFTCKAHGLSFPRGFRVLRDGREVARAMSLWALLRVADRTLVRADEGEALMVFGDEAELAMSQPLRVSIPRGAAFVTVGERHIGYADCDYNMHMNNTKYPNMVCDFLPDPHTARVTGMTLSYLREAALGATLRVERAAGERGTYYFRTYNGDTLCLEAPVQTEHI